MMLKTGVKVTVEVIMVIFMLVFIVVIIWKGDDIVDYNATQLFLSENFTEEIPARVLTKAEVENLNFTGAVVGYGLSGLLGGVVGGMIGGECFIPLMIEREPKTISVPDKYCGEPRLKENDRIFILKSTVMHKDSNGNVISQNVNYSWIHKYD